jgi:hypothetical protein
MQEEELRIGGWCSRAQVADPPTNSLTLSIRLLSMHVPVLHQPAYQSLETQNMISVSH